ncbi:MAG: hypothetical protein AB8B54_10010 [Sphingorhabdus sp.]
MIIRKTRSTNHPVAEKILTEVGDPPGSEIYQRVMDWAEKLLPAHQLPRQSSRNRADRGTLRL